VACKRDSDIDPMLAVSLDKALTAQALCCCSRWKRAAVFPETRVGALGTRHTEREWRELLEKISFLKVGHHGSHNASP